MQGWHLRVRLYLTAFMQPVLLYDQISMHARPLIGSRWKQWAGLQRRSCILLFFRCVVECETKVAVGAIATLILHSTTHLKTNKMHERLCRFAHCFHLKPIIGRARMLI